VKANDYFGWDVQYGVGEKGYVKRGGGGVLVVKRDASEVDVGVDVDGGGGTAAGYVGTEVLQEQGLQWRRIRGPGGTLSSKTGVGLQAGGMVEVLEGGWAGQWRAGAGASTGGSPQFSDPVSLGSGRDFWSGRKNGGVGWVQSTRRRLPDRWVFF
jgi:hypothetical protein